MAALKPDTTLTTASVQQVAGPSGEAAIDGRAILAVLSHAEGPEAVGREWENPESGARGLITAAERQEEDGQTCLAFTTTRESFDGVHLYRGLACENTAGALRINDLAMQ